MSKAIQLTNIDKTAIWIDKQGNKHQMSDLDDTQLQEALVTCQIMKIKHFMAFKGHANRECQLKKEAKNRNMNILDIDYLPKATPISAKFTELKEVMITAYNSIVRKIKKDVISK